jgi:hypothetical protein
LQVWIVNWRKSAFGFLIFLMQDVLHKQLAYFGRTGMVCAEVSLVMKTKPLMVALTSAAVLFCGLTLPVMAQEPVPPPMPAYQPLSNQQLDQLLGPIALYPDPLLAVLLPAATLPAQIVLADRYVSNNGDPNQIINQPWDASVQALAHYPTVLQYMDNNLAWTTEVGEAFLNQQQEVMESVQRLRLSAENYGNLQSTPQQQVVNDDGGVEILPADPDVVYVPVYEPDAVYFQGGFGLGFGVACTIGPWLNCDFDWVHHDLRFWDRNHPRPANWWHERAGERSAALARQTTAWRPPEHRGGYAGAGRGDRGWNNNIPVNRSHPTVVEQHNTTVVNMSRPSNEPRPMATPRPMAIPRPAAEPAPVVRRAEPFQVPSRAAPAINPGANGAFIGSESSHEARDFSNRGQQSMQAVTHSEPAHSEPVHSEAPAAHSAPAAPSGGGGGGGGFHGGGGGGRR